MISVVGKFYGRVFKGEQDMIKELKKQENIERKKVIEFTDGTKVQAGDRTKLRIVFEGDADELAKAYPRTDINRFGKRE